MDYGLQQLLPSYYGKAALCLFSFREGVIVDISNHNAKY